MRMEADRYDPGIDSHCSPWFMAARTHLPTGRSSRPHYSRNAMNILPALQTVFDEVTRRFGNRLTTLPSHAPNEVYFEGRMDLVAGFCGHLYKRWNARLVCLFADDSRVETGA